MPKFKVTGPDGKSYIVTAPEGATAQQAMEIAAQQAQANRPKSFWQGALEGVSTPVYNMLDALSGKVPGQQARLPSIAGGIATPALDLLAAYGRATSAKQKRNSPYRGSTAGVIAGNIAGTLPTMTMPGGVVAQGAAQGYLASEAQGAKGRLFDTGIGAVAGKVGEQAGKRVIAPVAERIGRTAPARKVAQAAVAAANKLGAKTKVLPLPQFTRADRALAPEAAVARQNIEDAARLGLPYSPADASPQLRQLAGNVSRFSPDARAMAEQAYQPRALQTRSRAIDAMDQHLAPIIDGTVEQRGRDIMDAAKDTYEPLYTSAFEGGSMAPLQAQLEREYANAGRMVSEAGKALTAAQNALTVSRAGVNRAGNNVYSNASALPADREAAAALKAAESNFAQAKAAQEQVLEVMRRAQSDAASDAPGAVWNPRIQQFLDDPISRPGLARGIEIQRLEALAKGEPFNPTEYAVTGFDEAGNPIVGNVPNMRTMDSIKKGWDAIIEDYPKDFRGNPILDERGRAIVQVKKAMLKELDGLNDDYGAARAAYGEAAETRGALMTGYKTLPSGGLSSRQSAAIIDGITPENLPEAATGYVTARADEIGRMSQGDPYKAVYGSLDEQAKIRQLFPEEGVANFDRMAALEKDMAQTYTETLGGSATQPRAISDAQFAGMGPDVIAAGVDLAGGGGAATAANMVRRGITGKLADRWALGGFGAKGKADALAPILFNTDPRAALAALTEIARKQAEQEARTAAYRRVSGIFGAPLGASIAISGR